MTRSHQHELPPITVVIPTRDRGDSVVRTLRSILGGTLAPAEVVVADQSREDTTERAVTSLRAGSRVRYLRTTTSGISAGLNRGIEAAGTDCVAITGDDCDVAPTWLAELVRELSSSPVTGVVFGAVLPGLDPAKHGFTPSYALAERIVARSIYEKHRVAGTSACMALRKSVWERLGGFDEMLGVGSALRSAEEADFAIRALLAGLDVCETPAAAVVHHGHFSNDERRQLIQRNWYGTGAAFAKPLKMGHPAILIALARLCLSWLRSGSRVAAGLGVGPHRLTALSAFLSGAWAGLRQPVDRSRGHFRAAS